MTHSARPTRPHRPRIPRAPLAVGIIAAATLGLAAALFVVNADPPSSPTGTPALVVPESPNAPSVGVQPVTPLPEAANNPAGPLDGNPAAGVPDYRVPEQMAPGTWITDGSIKPETVICEWQRTRPRSDGDTQVKEGSTTDRPTYVTVEDGDEFRSTGCKPWRMS